MPALENELKNVYRYGKVILGERTSLRSLKLGRGRLVVIAGNAKPEIKERVRRLCSLQGIQIIEFPGTSLELGYTIGKPYPVQVLLVVDPGESRILELAQTPEVK